MADALDLDHAGAGQPARTAQQVDVPARQPALLARVGIVRHHEVPPGQRGLDVHLRGRGGLARALHRLARAQQRLRRYAGPVGALAADQFALDDGDAQAARRQRGRAVLAGRPAAENDHVVVAHAGSFVPACPSLLRSSVVLIAASPGNHVRDDRNPGSAQPVVQGRSFSGLRTTQMCLIRSPATSNANTVTMTPSCSATRPGWPLTVRSRNVMVPGARLAISTQARAICAPPSMGCRKVTARPPPSAIAVASGSSRPIRASMSLASQARLKALTTPACWAAGLAGACDARMRRRADVASWRHAAGVRPTISPTSANE